MSEPEKEPEKPRDETAVPKSVPSDNAGSEFDTREVPLLAEPAGDTMDLDDTVVNVRQIASENATRVIQRQPRDDTDEFATKDQRVADKTHPGSDFPTDYFRREDMQDAVTREVPALKKDWQEKAAEVAAAIDAVDISPVPAETANPSFAVPTSSARDMRATAEEPAAAKPIYDAARRAQGQWAALRFEQRLPCFHRLQAELVIQRNDYAPSLASSIGRPMVETICGEYMPVLEALRTIEDIVPPLLVDQHGAGPSGTATGAHALVRNLPWGVVLVFTPSDSPFALPMVLALDALAAGNAVVLCPGERHPRVAENMRKLFMRASFPDGLVQVVGGEWRDRRGLLESGPDLALFEGDAGQADQVARAGVEFGFAVRVGRATKEIMLVLESADMDHAVAAGLWASFAGGGFARGRVERIVVAQPWYDEFRMKFVDGLRTLNSHHAQLANIADSLHPQRFQTVISDAVARGARVTWPAGEEPGRWIHWKGGVIESLPDSALASVERLEGPACALYRAEDVADEALRLHRLCPASNISVMGAPTRAQRTAIERLPAARICFGEPTLYGGSFAGGGADGVSIPRVGAGPRLMLRPQVVMDSAQGRRRVGWFPYTDDKAYALMDCIEAEYHPDAMKRMKSRFKADLNGHRRRLLRGED